MKNNIESYINSFLEYLKDELNYSSKTIITYNNALKKFQQYLNDNKIDFLNLNHDIALKYKAYLISKNLEAKTSSLNLSATRSFYNYLVEIRVLSVNPFLNMKNPKIAKKLPNFLNKSDLDTLFNNIDYEDDLKLRNIFIMEFLYVTGLRVSELCHIKLTDFDFKEQTIRIIGKGSKERIVYYKAISLRLFKHYLDVSRVNILAGTPSEYLIISKSGKPLTTRAVEVIIQKLCQEKNIKNKVTPHTMRHTFATDLLNNNADIRSVGELLGHESLDTTQIYTHVTSEKLKSVYNSTHPRQKKSNNS